MCIYHYLTRPESRPGNVKRASKVSANWKAGTKSEWIRGETYAKAAHDDMGIGIG
jgi:hypothetical protein